MNLLDLIKNKTAVIGIVGLGYIGLPVASYFASQGFKIKGVDLNSEIVDKIKKGDCPLKNEPGFNEVFQKALPRLDVSTDSAILDGCDLYIVCVQTPVKDGKPNTSYLQSAVKTVKQYLEPGKLVIIESTVPPGTSRELYESIEIDGIYFAHCPERVIPGNLCNEFVQGDRLIGGIDEKSSELAKELYSHVVSGDIEISECTTAELVKVIENTYRNTNIALANEIALISDNLGIDAYKAIELANRHPRVHIHQPGCGVGGHCIPVAPILLTNGKKRTPSVIQTGLDLNQGMSSYFTKLLEHSLNSKNIKLENSIIIMMGYAYKGDSNEVKQTPAEPIYQNLLKKGAKVLRFDPYVEGMELNNWKDFYSKLSKSSALLLVTNHSMFNELDLSKVKTDMKNPLIVDGRGFFDPEQVKSAGVDYDGIGV